MHHGNSGGWHGELRLPMFFILPGDGRDFFSLFSVIRKNIHKFFVKNRLKPIFALATIEQIVYNTEVYPLFTGSV